MKLNKTSFLAALKAEEFRFIEEKIRLLELLANEAEERFSTHSVRNFINSMQYED